MQRITILAGSSQSLISDSGDSEFYRQRQRKEAVSAEIKASLDLYFGGQGKEEKQLRLAVSELIFAVKSKEAADQLPLEQLERGLRILHAYEKVPQRNLENKDSVLKQISEVIREYDQGLLWRPFEIKVAPLTDIGSGDPCWARGFMHTFTKS
jgi:hypothetical protein